VRTDNILAIISDARKHTICAASIAYDYYFDIPRENDFHQSKLLRKVCVCIGELSYTTEPDRVLGVKPVSAHLPSISSACYRLAILLFQK